MSTANLAPISRCDRCGAELEPGDRFCSNCGQTVSTELARPEPTYWSDTASQWSSTAPSVAPTYSPYDSGSRGGIGKLFSASGRISRLEYFLTILGVWGILIIAWVVIVALDAPALTVFIGGGAWLIGVVISICAGVKRLHDFDQSGWLYLLFLVPFASFILLLILLFKGSSPGLNQYGYADSGSVMA
jgi:uncharacterized membrane protein YhaH (DUF805 family)